MSSQKYFFFRKSRKAGAKFDFDKTKWFNQQYLRAKTGEELSELVAPFKEGKEIEKSYFSAVCDLMKERATFKRCMGAKPVFLCATVL